MSSSRYPYNNDGNSVRRSARPLTRPLPRSEFTLRTPPRTQVSQAAVTYESASSIPAAPASAAIASASGYCMPPLSPTTGHSSSAMASRTHKVIRPVVAGLYASFQDFARQRDPERFFVVGKVFVMLHNTGENDIDSGSQISRVTPGNPHGDSPFAQTRRFVVISPGEGQCFAIPIRTYYDRGVSESTDRKSDHAIIYTTPHPPELLPSEYSARDESPVRAQSIMVKSDDLGTKLSEFSRLNFRKLYCIDHGCRVRSFGAVRSQSLCALIDQFRLVWRDSSTMSAESVRCSTSSEPSWQCTASQNERHPFPDFARRHDARTFFTFGRVFSVPWVDQGVEDDTTVSRIEYSPTYTRYGRLVPTRVRKFVVIRNEIGSCRALAIQTYGQQGVGKAGVVKSEHGVIFSGASPPPWLPTEIPSVYETGMQPYPIHITPVHPSIQLDILSRLNYKKIYAVQHDVRVKYLGDIDAASMNALRSQFETVQTSARQSGWVASQASTVTRRYTMPGAH